MRDRNNIRGSYPDETWGEKRRQPRFPDSRPVHVNGQRGTIEDISASGARIRMRRTPPVGTVLEVEFMLGDAEIRALGIVRRSDTQTIGVQFIWAPRQTVGTMRSELRRHLAEAA